MLPSGSPYVLAQTSPLPSGALVIDRHVTIEATCSEAACVVIDAGQSSRVFEVSANGVVTLRRLGITGGVGNPANVHESGGGIRVDLGALTLEACHVFNNHCLRSGGGIAVEQGVLVMYDTVVSGNSNTAGNGGGIYLWTNMATTTGMWLYRCTIRDNTASHGGGGMYAKGHRHNVHPDVHIEETTIASNVNLGGWNQYRGYGGGALISAFANTTFLRSLVVNNSAGGDGGGVALPGAGNTRMLDTVVRDNRAQGSAGGIYHEKNTDGNIQLTLQITSFERTSIYNNTAAAADCVLPSGNIAPCGLQSPPTASGIHFKSNNGVPYNFDADSLLGASAEANNSLLGGPFGCPSPPVYYVRCSDAGSTPGVGTKLYGFQDPGGGAPAVDACAPLAAASQSCQSVPPPSPATATGAIVELPYGTGVSFNVMNYAQPSCGGAPVNPDATTTYTNYPISPNNDCIPLSSATSVNYNYCDMSGDPMRYRGNFYYNTADCSGAHLVMDYNALDQGDGYGPCIDHGDGTSARFTCTGASSSPPPPMTNFEAWQANCCGAPGRRLGEEEVGGGGWGQFAHAIARANEKLFIDRPEVKAQHEQALRQRAITASGVVGGV